MSTQTRQPASRADRSTLAPSDRQTAGITDAQRREFLTLTKRALVTKLGEAIAAHSTRHQQACELQRKLDQERQMRREEATTNKRLSDEVRALREELAQAAMLAGRSAERAVAEANRADGVIDDHDFPF